MWATYSSRPKSPAESGTSRALFQSVMWTSQSASMVCTVARRSVAKWPDIGATMSTLGCGVARSFSKRSRRQNCVAGDDRLLHVDGAVLYLHPLQREGWALVGDFGIGEHVGGGGEQAGARPGPGDTLFGHEAEPEFCPEARRCQKVGLGLVELVEHAVRGFGLAEVPGARRLLRCTARRKLPANAKGRP